MYKIRSVTFTTPQEIFNRGSLHKVAMGMESLELVESDEPSKPGVFIYSTDPRVTGRLWVPIFSIGSIRYDEVIEDEDQ